MRLVSTLRSSHRGEVSLLAIAETVVASAVSLWVAVRYETLIHIAVSAVLATALLFRTQRSDRYVRNIYLAFWNYPIKLANNLNRFTASSSDKPHTSGTASRNNFVIDVIFNCVVFILFVVVTAFMILDTMSILAIRIFALIKSIHVNALPHLVSIRKNWRRIVLCTDSGTLPEAIPGIELRASTLEDGFFKPFRFQTWLDTSIVKNQEKLGLWKYALYLFRLVNGMLLFLPAIIQRLSFKSVSLFFLPLLFVVNSDVIRPDLSLSNRLTEFARDNLSKLKFVYALFTIVVVGGSMALTNLAASLYQLGEEHLSVVGRALCEYYVPPGGVVTVKVWQVAQLVNAAIFLYMFVIYVPRMIRRSAFEPPRKFVPEVKSFLWWVDVVTITLSLYTLSCGIAIVLQYVITHKFPPKVFQFFPAVG